MEDSTSNTRGPKRRCPFCNRPALEPRVFFEGGNWFAFLAAPFLVRGHAIIAAKGNESACPDVLNAAVLTGVDLALAEVAGALRQHFQPKDILFSCLRGDNRHVHFHAIPLWPEVEREWRRQTLYEGAHLQEFLGHLELTAHVRDTTERIEHGWDKEEQRSDLVRCMSGDVDALRRISGYISP